MSMLSKAVAALREVVAPQKLKTGEQTVPRYITRVAGRQISNLNTNTTSVKRDVFARGSNALNEVIMKLVLTSPDLSHAVASKLSMIISTEYTVLARDKYKRIDAKGTELLHEFCQRLDTTSHDYSRFVRSTDLRSVSASLLFDLLRYGEMGCELVLDKLRSPHYIKPFSTQNLKWEEGKGYEYPVFQTKDGDVPLNYPTVFISTSTRDTTSPYAFSPLQTAIQASLNDIEFIDDLRRAASRQLMQRLAITIDSEKFRKSLPLDVQNDRKELKKYIDNTIADVENHLRNLAPEDALVFFDHFMADTLGDSNRSDDRTIKALSEIISGQVAAGSKTLPSILGRGSGGSDSSSMEAMLFMRSLTDIQNELNILYGRVLTLVLRLFGYKTQHAVFKYTEPSLRPDIETESFKLVRQARVYEQLSMGLITDIEASILTTGTLPPAGYKNLSGTMFKVNKPDGKDNPYSNTGATSEGRADDTQSGKNIRGK